VLLRLPHHDPFLLPQRGACGPHLKTHALRTLQVINNFKQIPRSGIPIRAKHLVKRLGVEASLLGELRKSDGGIYVIPKHPFANRKFSGKKTLDRVAQHTFTKHRVALYSRLNRLFEIASESQFI
jgi:hypothetical protein